MGGLFQPPTPTPQLPPVAPTLRDPGVDQAAADSVTHRRGRASTILTDPQQQRAAQDAARTLLGGF